MQRTMQVAKATMLLVATQGVWAETSSLIPTTPECATPCLLEVFQGGGCEIERLADCVCTNNTLQAHVSACIQMSCEFSDQVATAEGSQAMCRGYPVQTERRDFCRAFLTAVPVFTIAIILLRCAARKKAKLKLWWDDWTALAAMCVLLFTIGCGTAHTELGFGLHFWNIAPGNAKPILQLFYVTQMTYILMQIAAKSSICLLYMRIFVTPWFRKAVICLIAIILSQHVLFLFLIIFQCTPIQSIWNKYISGHCLNLTAIGYAGGSFTVAYDVILITLPIPELLKLNLSLRKKIISVLMLALGSFATVASMIRLKYMVSFAHTFDATWDNVDVVVWSCLEMNLVMICGSLPALHPLFRAIANLFRPFNPFPRGILGSKSQGLEKTAEPSQPQDPNHPSPC